jgi:molybdenum cofactor biosynthesis enzyme MoaA
MLRFPLWLAADLARARIAQNLLGASGTLPILFLRPREGENPSALDRGEISADEKSGTGLLARVRNSSASVVWIGGPEPLLHAEMGQLTRCIAEHGQHLFLETDGALLRRRIHEFRPTSRFFLTVLLDGLEPSHNLRAGRPDAFEMALEGIRAAKVSGFLICVHARIDRETNLGEISKLLRFAESLDVDGFLISQAAPSANNKDHDLLKQKTAEARKLMRNRWWESFSRLAQTAFEREHDSEQSAAARSARQETKGADEGVRVA